MPTHDTLAQRPPLGWNSYDCFNAAVTEEEVKANAQVMAVYLQPLGYQYLVIDYAWYYPVVCHQQCPVQREGFVPALSMDEYGRLHPALDRFPSAAGGRGFAPLADALHALGLKLGIHLMRGIPREAVARRLPVLGAGVTADQIADPAHACRWLNHNVGVDMTKPGAQAYYDSVFRLYASWGVDFVKVDDICTPYATAEIEAVHAAIARCGRPIVLSLSPGNNTPLEQADHLAAHAHMWRVSGDYWDEWPLLKAQFPICERWQGHAGPGHWPDADMLTIGRLSLRGSHGPERYANFTPDELRTMLTLWSVFRSPLMIGGDLRQMRTPELNLLTNPEVLAVDQASACNRQLFRTDTDAAWAADVPDSPDRYLALFNLADAPRSVAADLAALDLPADPAVRDLWERTDLGPAPAPFALPVPPHGVRLVRLSPRGQ